MNFTLYQYKYISKDDSTYLKVLAILIMICLHVFGSRAVNLPAYQQMDDFVFMGRPLSFCLSRFCSICVHIYILLSGYGLFIVYRRKVEKGVGMKNLKRISLLMAKVILVGTIFYPISLFYPDLQWHFSFMECVRMLLGYSGNYEWWFLRPYLIIAALSPFLLKGINKKSVICLTISLLLYFLTKYLIYFHDFHLFVILEQVFILCLPFFLGAILAKYGILAWAKSISQSHFAVFLSITVLMVMLLYKFYFPSGIIDPFISAVFVICCIILTNIVKSGGVYNLLTTLGKEATSMCLIHTFISIYYWSGLTYSFQYPILIFLFVVICSYILSIAITMPYNIIRKRIESLFT